MESQLTHQSTSFKPKKFPITIICDSVHKAPNIGSLFRIADAFGVEHIIFCGEHIPVKGRRMTKTSRAAEKYVSHKYATNIMEEIDILIKQDYKLIAIEITNSSTAIEQTDFSDFEKVALLIGAEDIGISEEILKLTEDHLHINMFGKNSSMNVVQATAIALYEITKQWNSVVN
jgi:tRNA G18 (ribose-2'-O)-methylase SpoU